MFYYLNGTVALIDQNLAVIDCGGVGYACKTTSTTISQLQVGKASKLYTYENIIMDNSPDVKCCTGLFPKVGQ